MANEKYTFTKVSNDNFKLEYGKKSFEFKLNVNIVKEMQDIVKRARLKMIQELKTEYNMTIQDLVVEKKENGKTLYDNSNKEYIEQSYLEGASVEFFNSFCEEHFKLDFMSLIADIGLNEEETEVFSGELANILTSKTPS